MALITVTHGNWIPPTGARTGTATISPGQQVQMLPAQIAFVVTCVHAELAALAETTGILVAPSELSLLESLTPTTAVLTALGPTAELTTLALGALLVATPSPANTTVADTGATLGDAHPAGETDAPADTATLTGDADTSTLGDDDGGGDLDEC